MTIARPPGIRHHEDCTDPTSVHVEYRYRGTRPFVICEGCGAAGVVPTLATGSARAGYFATHDLIYTHPKKRSRTMFSNNRPTHDPTPPPAAAEKPADYLPLTLVAAELAELGLDDPNHLARHVGRTESLWPPASCAASPPRRWPISSTSSRSCEPARLPPPHALPSRPASSNGRSSTPPWPSGCTGRRSSASSTPPGSRSSSPPRSSPGARRDGPAASRRGTPRGPLRRPLDVHAPQPDEEGVRRCATA